MIASQKKEVLREFDFVSQQKAYSFQRLLASVNVITEEKIICIRWESTEFEDSQEIGELPVDITTDLNGCLKFQQHRLLQEYLPGFHADRSDLIFCQDLILRPFSLFGVYQLLQYVIYVYNLLVHAYNVNLFDILSLSAVLFFATSDRPFSFH